MTIALASPRVASTVEEAFSRVRRDIAHASSQGARIVCFPEAYLPGLRGLDVAVPTYELADQERALADVGSWAREHDIAVVLGLEWIADAGRHIAAAVFGPDGDLLGVQTKNQLDPSEEARYVAGDTRRLFEVDGLRFGVAICHEAFRYPETVRWAARRGAHVVFHPHWAGSDQADSAFAGPPRALWGEPSAAYYEKAMMCRGLENTIYFASVNAGFQYPESATTLIGPDGDLVAHAPYGVPSVLVCEIDPDRATGRLAARYAPERYQDA